MKRVRSFFWLMMAALMAGAVSPVAQACTVCFGKSDSDLAKGMNMGIFALLLVITSVLCGVAGFFVFLARRSSQTEQVQYAPSLSQNRTNA